MPPFLSPANRKKLKEKERGRVAGDNSDRPTLAIASRGDRDEGASKRRRCCKVASSHAQPRRRAIREPWPPKLRLVAARCRYEVAAPDTVAAPRGVVAGLLPRRPAHGPARARFQFWPRLRGPKLDVTINCKCTGQTKSATHIAVCIYKYRWQQSLKPDSQLLAPLARSLTCLPICLVNQPRRPLTLSLSTRDKNIPYPRLENALPLLYCCRRGRRGLRRGRSHRVSAHVDRSPDAVPRMFARPFLPKRSAYTDGWIGISLRHF